MSLGSNGIGFNVGGVTVRDDVGCGCRSEWIGRRRVEGSMMAKGGYRRYMGKYEYTSVGFLMICFRIWLSTPDADTLFPPLLLNPTLIASSSS